MEAKCDFKQVHTYQCASQDTKDRKGRENAPHNCNLSCPSEFLFRNSLKYPVKARRLTFFLFFSLLYSISLFSQSRCPQCTWSIIEHIQLPVSWKRTLEKTKRNLEESTKCRCESRVAYWFDLVQILYCTSS